MKRILQAALAWKQRFDTSGLVLADLDPEARELYKAALEYECYLAKTH